MQNKGAIWGFTILLIIACLYQLSFTWVASSVNADAKADAITKVDSIISVGGNLKDERKDSLLLKYENEYLTSKSHEIVFLGYTLKKVKQNELNMGLDLQGGMSVTLEVSVQDVIKALSGNSTNPTFKKALANAIINQKNSQDNFVTIFGDAFKKVDPNAKLAAIFHTRENKEKFPREATNDEILDIIRAEAESAISRTEQVIRKRIDNLGVIQPKVQRLESTGRIIVELPGVKNKARVRKILQGTAKLEFWEAYQYGELHQNLNDLNALIARKIPKKKKEEIDSTAETSSETVTAEKDTVITDEQDDLLAKISGDSGATESAATDTTAQVDQAVAREEYMKNNPLFALLNRYTDNKGIIEAKSPRIGYVNVSDTMALNKFLNSKEAKTTMPPRIKFYYGAKPFDDNEQFVNLYAMKVTNRDGSAPLDGDQVADARPSTDPLGKPEVSMTMNSEGAKTWKNLTRDVAEKKGFVAIVLDNYVYSAPSVNGEISGGRTSISGSFTVEEATDLSNVLKAGKLPAPARIIEEAIVGPSLGAEAVSSGLTSFIVALIIILMYMIFYYAKAGVAADIALVANLFFIMGILASFGATLTLPGIAGIVLTIGMSVDANVLIFERIREEISNGKGIKLAISDGYSNAYSSIIDANLTTGFTALALLIFGSGPIKGFATTLLIGIATSLFSAIFITRLIFEWQLGKNDKISFSTKITEGAFKDLTWKFIAKRRLFYVLSGVVIIIGLGSFMVRGFNFGVDFTGGHSYLIRFDKSIKAVKVADALEIVFVNEQGKGMRPEVKTFGSSNQVKITTNYMIDDDTAEADDKIEAKLSTGLKTVDPSFEIMSSQKVGPTIADDLKVDAFYSIFFSLLIIFAYIVFRFKKWQFGLGALAAMIHDVLIVLAIFSLGYGFLPFSLEIDQAFIAAILTVVGYSINDTVVVFDRIREYMGLHKRTPMKENINNALNSTLSRTINTSLSTFFVLLVIFIFGGEVIRGFVFALMVGVVVGTYSSLCIATPMVVDLIKKEDQ